MSQFFALDYSGEPFILFGIAHLTALAIIAILAAGIIIYRDRFGPRLRSWTRYGLAVILLVNESAWHLWNYFTGQWTVQTMLPLHLCSVLVFASAYMLLTKNERTYEFVYFLGIGGATQALLTPDAGVYGFPHFRFFQVMISHGAIFLSALYMTFVEGWRPYWSSLRRVIIWGNVYMIAIFILNRILGSNYLFIAHKPETASLIDVLGPWPLYILSLEGIALLMSLLLYMPYAIKDRRTARVESAQA